jgi:hypothetical protein
MTVNTSRLGIFELIGYLFAGVYVLTVVVAPVFASGLILFWLPPGATLAEAMTVFNVSPLVGLALLVVSYAVGIFASRRSMKYYERSTRHPHRPDPSMDQGADEGQSGKDSPGVWTKIIKYLRRMADLVVRNICDLLGNLRMESGNNEENRERPAENLSKYTPTTMWDLVDQKIQSLNVSESVSELFDKKQLTSEDKEQRETLYQGFAYSSPLLHVVDRIASVVRFASAIVVGSVLSIGVLAVCGVTLVGFYHDRAGWSVAFLVASAILLALNVIFGLYARSISKEYADSYWTYVGMGILSIPVPDGNSHSRDPSPKSRPPDSESSNPS